MCPVPFAVQGLCYRLLNTVTGPYVGSFILPSFGFMSFSMTSSCHSYQGEAEKAVNLQGMADFIESM